MDIKNNDLFLHFLSVIFLIVVSTLSACADNSESAEEGLVSETYLANYYREDSSRSAAVVPVFINSEVVERPAINYVGRDFNDIDSLRFHAIWRGKIAVENQARLLNFNFSVTAADVAFYLDDELVSSWSNSHKIIPMELGVGIHNVRIEYHNNAQVTQFNMSTTSYKQMSRNEAKHQLPKMISKDTRIVYIASHQADDVYNNVLVDIEAINEPVFLVLSSFASINWQVKANASSKVVGVAVHSDQPGSTVAGVDVSTVLNIHDMNGGYEDLSAVEREIANIMGRSLDYSYGKYALSSITVPKLVNTPAALVAVE